MTSRNDGLQTDVGGAARIRAQNSIPLVMCVLPGEDKGAGDSFIRQTAGTLSPESCGSVFLNIASRPMFNDDTRCRETGHSVFDKDSSAM